MDDERRARFRLWFAAVYGPDSAEARAKFMADSGKRGEEPLTKGRVTQLFDDDQPFGERAARSLSRRFGMEDPDFFLHDQLTENAPIQRAAANLRVLRRINPETFDGLVGEIARITEGAKAADRLIRMNTKAAYVDTQRADEKLGKNTGPARKPRQITGFGGFDQFPSASVKGGKAKK